MPDKAYIIILNYNGWRDTIECLESVLKSTHQHYTVIVVDNNSTDNSYHNILEWSKGEIHAETSDKRCLQELVLPEIAKPISVAQLKYPFSNQAYATEQKLILIQSAENKGFSAGNNIGIRLALADPECKYIWLLNNDTVVYPDTLEKLAEVHKNTSTTEKLGILGCRLFHYNRPEIQQAYAGKFDKLFCIPIAIGEGKHEEEVSEGASYDYVVGASLFVSSDFIRDVGLLNENYFLYFEELDWAIRSKRKGWTMKIDANNIIYHKQGSSTGNSDKDSRSAFSDRIHVESKVLFLRNYYPWLLPIAFATFPFVLLNRIRRGQFGRLPELVKTLLSSLFIKQKQINL